MGRIYIYIYLSIYIYIYIKWDFFTGRSWPEVFPQSLSLIWVVYPYSSIFQHQKVTATLFFFRMDIGDGMELAWGISMNLMDHQQELDGLLKSEDSSEDSVSFNMGLRRCGKTLDDTMSI